MSSEDIGLVPDQRIDNSLTSPPLVFQDDPLRFNCGTAPHRRVGDPGPKTRELAGGFIDEKMFAIDRDRFFTAQGSEFRRSVYADCHGRRNNPDDRNWSGNGGASTPSGDDSDGDDDEDDDEDDDDDDDEGDAVVDRLVGVGDGSKRNSNAITGVSNNSGSGVANGKAQHHSPYGMKTISQFCN